jgi:putative endopeptidase
MDRRSFLGLSTSVVSFGVLNNLGLVNNAYAATKPKIGSFGFDMAGRDLKIKAGNDFFAHGGGTWMKNNQIPNDRSRWGVFDQLAAKAEEDVRNIIDELAAKKSAQGSIEQKIGDYYSSYMNVDAINAKGLTPLKADLDIIAAALTHEDLAKIIGRPDVPANSPIGWGIGIDDGNPNRYIVTINHGGLGLPERDYYLKDDARMKELRAKYPTYIAKMLSLAGIADADKKANEIFAFETEIAKLHWPITDRRDSTKMYNIKKRADLETIAPDFPWEVALSASGITNISEIVIGELSAMGPLAKLFKSTSVETLKNYMSFHCISGQAGILPKDFDDARFDFFGKTLNGQKEQRARWKRATQAVNGSLGEAIGQVYVARHFSPNAKAQMVDLVENLRKAFKVRIAGLKWMSAATKTEAYKKLASFNPKIGYPNKWKDYSKLEVIAGDAYGNSKRATLWDHNEDIAKLNKPTDKDEWFMSPQTVNAYYNPAYNEIVFPAAILQAPFFDENADPAVNYGAIGAVIGHEMGHGFDDQGAKYDDKGVLRDWWKPTDVKAFDALGDKMVAQYGNFEALSGVKLNGRLTLGENIGDHCGVVVGLVAYQISLGGKKSPIIEGLNGDQRFFYSWSQVWRALSRDEALRNQVQSDPHSPAKFRVNGTVQNVDAWYKAFNVKPGDKLYVAPEKRVRIW